MKKAHIARYAVGAVLLLSILACRGNRSSSTPAPQVQPTEAILTLSSAVTGTFPATTTLNSYVVTVGLPEGVTVRTLPSSPVTAAGVVTASGMASRAYAEGVYTAPSGSAPATVRIFVAGADGFAAGEFCVVHADIADGVHPTAADFGAPTVEDATGYDRSTDSTVIGLENELSATLAVEIR